MWIKDKFKNRGFNIVVSKIRLFHDFIKETTIRDYRNWELSDDKSLYEWFVERTVNKLIFLITCVLSGFFIQYALSVHTSQTMTVPKVIANTALIWLSLRLIVLLKKRNEE